ncbi:MAG: hydroxyphenylacetyl-CoA thioesterase PaaI [Bacteroidetes bacterium]|nr:MAG: hydroxyphenylacetyl-CoA thioesterase PaaI [Bacteroidota bacterium]
MQTKAQRIVRRMYDHDPFSQWLGIEVLEVREGFCRLRMEVREEMLNGFGIAHGGISYSLADSAFAFASNSHGRHAVSIETSISHTRAVHTGDVLLAQAQVQHLSNRLGIYEVQVRREDGTIVALFKGTVFRKDREWEPSNPAD